MTSGTAAVATSAGAASTTAGSAVVARVHVGAKRSLTNGGGSLRDPIALLTGSPDYLVYYGVHQSVDALVGGGNVSPPRVSVRSASGKIIDLGVATRPFGKFSITGTTVTGQSDGAVLVYSAVTGAHTRVTLPAGSQYLGAAPDGVLYSIGATLYKLSASGQTTSLGQPNGSASGDIYRAAVGPDGVVVTDSSTDAAYVPFDDPTNPVALNTSGTTKVYCESVSTTAAACVSPNTVLYLPLNGSAPTVADRSAQYAAISGDHVVFAAESTSDDHLTTLDSMQAGSAAVSSSTDKYEATGVVSAYGYALAVSHVPGDDTSFGNVATVASPIVAARSATDVKTLFLNPRSPKTAGAFSLVGNQISYTTDEPSTNTPPSLVTVETRRLSTTGHTLKVTAATPVPGQRGSGANTIYCVATGGGNTVYDIGGKRTNDLRIVGPPHTKSVTLSTKTQPFDVHPTLYDGRLLYRAGYGQDGWRVYDLATKKSTVVADGAVDAALSGHYVAYATSHVGIYRKNLLTGKTVQIAKPGTRTVSNTFIVSVYQQGKWVGWATKRYPRKEPAQTSSFLRNAATMTKAARLPHTLDSLTPVGALLDTQLTLHSSLGTTDRTPIWLRTYTSSAVRQLLPAQRYNQIPQISVDGVMAWINGTGDLRVGSVRNVV